MISRADNISLRLSREMRMFKDSSAAGCFVFELSYATSFIVHESCSGCERYLCRENIFNICVLSRIIVLPSHNADVHAHEHKTNAECPQAAQINAIPLLLVFIAAHAPSLPTERSHVGGWVGGVQPTGLRCPKKCTTTPQLRHSKAHDPLVWG